MQEPVRDVYRGFEILLVLRHIEDGRIERLKQRFSSTRASLFQSEVCPSQTAYCTIRNTLSHVHFLGEPLRVPSS